MPETDSLIGREKSGGFLAGIGQSVREHLDERLKSPFGGAFVIAWIAVNWRPILIVFLSDEKIEQRIKEATANYIDWYNGFVLPILLAALIAIGFYIFSALFIVFFEIYQKIRGSIERFFDAAKWVPPSRYIGLKTKLNKEIRYFQDLASDNLGVVDEEREKTKEATSKLLQAQEELGKYTSAVATSANEKSELLNELNNLRRVVVVMRNQSSELSQEHSVLKNELQNIYQSFASIKQGLSLTSAQTNTSLWNKILVLENEIRNLSAENDNSERYGLDLSEHSVGRYLKDRFPGLPVNMSQLKRLIEEIRKVEPRGAANISGVHDALNKTMSALTLYANEKPQRFTSSVDYLSKAFGFLYPDFRKIHSFSDDSKKAFVDYDNLIER